MPKIKDLFYIERGNKFDFSKMVSREDSKINFVSRSSQNNGVVGKVEIYNETKPYEAGLITVTLGGSYLLSAFVQKKDFYTAQNIDVLRPKDKLTLKEKLFYCYCIAQNRFRYRAFGREANKTLKDIELPEKIPTWVEEVEINSLISKEKEIIYVELDIKKWREINLIDYFVMNSGKYYDKFEYETGQTPYISASDNMNGVMEFTNLNPDFRGNALTIGKVGITTFYQKDDFCATSDVTVLKPKNFELNKYVGLFIKTILELEKPKWSYGRQIRLNDCKELVIKLPVTKTGEPDWEFMEKHIKSLPYSEYI